MAFHFIEKHTPYLSLLVSLSLSRNNVGKTQFFSWWRPFQRKLLFFQTIESAKHAFAASAGSRKFLENEKQNSRKNYGAMFSREVQGHMQKLSSFGRGKKIRSKSHLRGCCTEPFICPKGLFAGLIKAVLHVKMGLA